MRLRTMTRPNSNCDRMNWLSSSKMQYSYQGIIGTERIDVSICWGEGAVGATAANTSKQNVWRSMYSVWSRALSSLHDKSRSHIIVICFRHCNQLLLVIDNELPGCCSVVRHCCSLRVPHTNYNEILTAINNRLRSYSWIQIEFNC